MPKPILRRLRDKANRNMASVGPHNGGSEPSSSTEVKTEDVDEALSIIGGTSRLVREERRPFKVAGTSDPLLSSGAPILPDTAPPFSDQRVDATPYAMQPLTYEPNYGTFGWEPHAHLPTRDHLPTDYSGVPNDASASTSAIPSQSNFGQPFENAMNTYPDNFEFNVAEMQPRDNGHFPDSYLQSQLSDVDVTIEDIWRTILEDPRLTNTGMNEPMFQF